MRGGAWQAGPDPVTVSASPVSRVTFTWPPSRPQTGEQSREVAVTLVTAALLNGPFVVGITTYNKRIVLLKADSKRCQTERMI